MTFSTTYLLWRPFNLKVFHGLLFISAQLVSALEGNMCYGSTASPLVPSSPVEPNKAMSVVRNYK